LNDSKPPVSAFVEVKIDKLHEDLHISQAAHVETYPTRPLIVGRGGDDRRARRSQTNLMVTLPIASSKT